MTSVEDLERKIQDIKLSSEYTSLIIKHRGPQEERRLYELNLRITSLENQKRNLAPKSSLAANKAKPASMVSRNNIVKAGNDRLRGKVQTSGAPVAEVSAPVKGSVLVKRTPGGAQRGMPTSAEVAEPSVKLTNSYNRVNKLGKPHMKGTVKASAKSGTLAPAMSKPTKLEVSKAPLPDTHAPEAFSDPCFGIKKFPGVKAAAPRAHGKISKIPTLEPIPEVLDEELTVDDIDLQSLAEQEIPEDYEIVDDNINIPDDLTDELLQEEEMID
jgi:hypothetical protein